MKLGFKEYLFNYIFIFLISILVFLVYMFLPFNKFTVLVEYKYGFLTTALVLFLLGGLSVCNFFGVFDTVTYLFRKDRSVRSLSEYSINKKAARKKGDAFPFYPYFLYTLVYLFIGLTFLIFT